MIKISRNDLCPCGSGKKYKKCCIDKILSFPTSNSPKEESKKTPANFSEMVTQHIQNNTYESLEEINQDLKILTKNYNTLPQDSFLGLSPSQMGTILQSPLSMDNDIFKISPLTSNDLFKIPLFNQALFFLQKLEKEGEMKGTQKGNLPKNFVLELYENFFSNDRYARRPNKEYDLPEATRIKDLLNMSGLIKKRSDKFSLTNKGKSFLEKKKYIEIFESIFINFASKWNWGQMDGYPNLFLIQQSTVFNFLLIHKKCCDWTLNKELGRFFLEAFPALINEVFPTEYSESDDQIIRCFSIRFLKRFCIPLGLLEHKEERVKKEKYVETYDYYKPTPLFVEKFTFKIK